MRISCVETVDILQDIIVRKNAFSQESQTVRANYPQVFLKFFTRLENEQIDKGTQNRWFCALCRRLRKDLVEGHDSLAEPAFTGSGGRLSKDEARLRNEFRRNVYVLVRELDGLKWWPRIESLIKRETAGKRPSSSVAKPIAELLHFILRDNNGELPDALNSAAIVDMANQLAYAKRHKVPFQFLIGFLAEVQFDIAAQKERAGEWEEWHRLSGRAETAKPSNEATPERAAKRPSAAGGAKDSNGKKPNSEETKAKKKSKHSLIRPSAKAKSRGGV